ncbi:MAG: electron transport complex subunit RsxB [Steroidobacteraceae bacterium]
MTPALLILILFAASGGWLLHAGQRRWTAAQTDLADRIDRLLPQTQCGRCSLGGCRPYAEALARNEADINQCPPGGEVTMRALANLLAREPKPIDPRYGVADAPRTVAWIDEERCIGCAKCILACPVDAIVGAPRFMHTVLVDECNGCELCIPPCPVDCIVMQPLPKPAQRAEPERL